MTSPNEIEMLAQTVLTEERSVIDPEGNLTVVEVTLSDHGSFLVEHLIITVLSDKVGEPVIIKNDVEDYAPGFDKEDAQAQAMVTLQSYVSMAEEGFFLGEF